MLMCGRRGRKAAADDNGMDIRINAADSTNCKAFFPCSCFRIFVAEKRQLKCEAIMEHFRAFTYYLLSFGGNNAITISISANFARTTEEYPTPSFFSRFFTFSSTFSDEIILASLGCKVNFLYCICFICSAARTHRRCLTHTDGLRNAN